LQAIYLSAAALTSSLVSATASSSWDS